MPQRHRNILYSRHAVRYKSHLHWAKYGRFGRGAGKGFDLRRGPPGAGLVGTEAAEEES